MMKTYKNINHIITAQKINMSGFTVDQPLPNSKVEQLDPFLLIHHANTRYLSGNHPRDLGVGPHPHRGFSPVTLVFQGAVHHRDSRGNSSIVEAGGTQWMHSGLGIVHSERPSKKLAMDGGIMEIIQFWVNVPGKNKMVSPTYTPLSEKDTPKVVDDERVKVSLVAGTMDGITGKIETFSPLLVLRIDLRKSGVYEFEVPENFNSLSYQLDGVVKVNKETELRGKQMAVFRSDPGWISFEALEKTRLIVLAGAPIGEPVAAQGPFVMNTDTQILQAMRDYQMGKMGMLIEKFD